MSSCVKCSKAVYFAEQVESSGYLFHRSCFRCTGCKKLLNLGAHSQHKEDPYCNNCYSKTHGPKSYSKPKPIVHQPRADQPKSEKVEEPKVEQEVQEDDVQEDLQGDEPQQEGEESNEHSDA
ncbi:hypothetical protein M3Y97_00105500 [Aphelenchoides bicaudatus]|nr:hypothetical protein M3Y97_00105500 [Aphelenchoides bicaudatus]